MYKKILCSYEKNPFEFRRSWTVTTQAQEDENSSREEMLERQLAELKEQLSLIQEKLFGSECEQNSQRAEKDKGMPPRKESTSSFLGRLRSSIIPREQEQESESSDPPPYSTSGSVENVRVGGSKTVFIKNVELTLNGQPLDMLDTEEGKAAIINNALCIFH